MAISSSVVSSSPPPPTSRAGYVDVDRLVNSDGITAVISQRRKTGVLTFAMFREYDSDDGRSRTSFVPQALGESYMQLLVLTIERMAALRVGGELPFPVRDDTGPPGGSR